jgi:bacillithiol biosynthesis cysteine-adding enzyme BshC
VNHVVLPAGEGSLRTLMTTTHAAENAPVENVRFGTEIEPVVAAAAELLGSSDIADVLREAYRPGASFGEAFGKLFARVFGEFGVILLDASDPELHKLAAPLYAEAIRHAADVDAALLARGEELRKAGFHEQVKVTSSSTLLFETRDVARTVIHRANGQFKVGEEKFTESELLERIASAPERFSANVLLRPVIQDHLLPTLLYTGGPAEVAYFAQAAVLYKKLLGRVTPVWPRMTLSLVEPQIKRLLERYKLSPADTFQDEEHLRKMLGERTLPGDLHQTFDTANASLEASLQAITEALARLDNTLVDAAKNAGAKMQYQLEHLRTRAANAETRRNEVLGRHASQLSASLFPEHNLQERAIGGVYFLSRYPGLLKDIYETVSPTCSGHQVVYL